MESIMGRSMSARSEIMVSLMKEAYSRRYRTLPKRSPIMKSSEVTSRLSGMMESMKECPLGHGVLHVEGERPLLDCAVEPV